MSDRGRGGRGGRGGGSYERRDGGGYPAGRGGPPRGGGGGYSAPRGGFQQGSQDRSRGGGGFAGPPRGGRGRTIVNWDGAIPPVGKFEMRKAPWDYDDEQSFQNRENIKDLILKRGERFQARKKEKGVVPFGRKWTDGSLVTNHYPLKIQLPLSLCRYEAEVEAQKRGGQGQAQGQGSQPQREVKINRDVLAKIMIQTVQQLKQEMRGLGAFTDFGRVIFTNKPLKAMQLSKLIRLPEEEEASYEYKVTLTEAMLAVDIVEVNNFINNLNFLKHPQALEVRQILNILIKNVADPDAYLLRGVSLLRRSGCTDYNYLGDNMMNWKGASLTVTAGSTWKPFLNVEVANCAVLIGESVLDAMKDIFGRDANMAYNVNQWREDHFKKVFEVLKSCKVTRKVKNQKTGKWEKRVQRLDGICGFASDSKGQKEASKITFQMDGRKVSVKSYFEQMGVSLKYPNGPVLILGGKAQVPAEFCTIKEGQSINRILSGRPQQNMLKQCTEKPDAKSGNISKIVNQELKLGNHALLHEFGVQVSTQMCSLPEARVLPPPDLCYGRDMSRPTQALKARVTPAGGEWDIWGTSVGFIGPARIERLIVVNVGANVDARSVQDFAGSLVNEGQKRGMQFGSEFSPNCYYNVNSRRIEMEDVYNCFQDALADHNLNAGKTLFVCIIREKGAREYGLVKQAAEKEGMAGVLTQCVAQKNISDQRSGGVNFSVVKNLLLKINAKMNGINHVPLYPTELNDVSILRIPTMVIGIDVTHGVGGGFSFAAVTGSINRSGMPYMMDIRAQQQADKGAAEVVGGLDETIGKFIQTFERKEKVKPFRIVVFRDGVGSGQFPEVLQAEMLNIRKACKDVGGEGYKPPITFIAVQKRHKVRFFIDRNGNIAHDNVPPGTVVDEQIVGLSDFYLVSHKGALGTSRPTHYNVLWDDSDFRLDELQGLAYFLCYNYSRCNKSVSYPAPTYYAHWAALRAKELAGGVRFDDTADSVNARMKRSDVIENDFPFHFI